MEIDTVDKQDRPELYIEAMKRLHMIVPLALLIPMVVQIPTYWMVDSQIAFLRDRMVLIYLSGLLLVIPAALIYLAESKIPRFFPFVLTSIFLIFLGMAGSFFYGEVTGLSVSGTDLPADLAILLLFFFDAMSIRFNENSRIRSKREGDLSWSGNKKLLSAPSAFQFVWFAAIYTVSLTLHNRGLGNAALTGAILYFFLYVPYVLLERRAGYLENRKHVRGIPARRIRRLDNRLLMSVLIPAGLLAVVSLMTAGGRHFLNLPSFTPSLDEEIFNYRIFGSNYLLWMILQVLNMGEEVVPPAWLVQLFSFLENLLTVICTAVIVYGLVRLFLLMAKHFRGIEREERKRRYTDDTDEHISLRRSASRPSTRYEAGVRRRYRKMILRYRGKAPRISETPSQMERLAGIPDTEEFRDLHEEYESVRYGKL